ncbi:MAG: sulfurtransferase TusA family protein [Sterolibacterium sp.]|nr:sulfurtransferase TusA family protein [Sterolibacterium sp.]
MTNQNLVTLDMSGMSCPAPLVGAKRVVDDLSPGQTLVLISDCPGTPDDLAVWARITGNEVFASEKLDGSKVAYSIRKGGAGKRQVNITLDIRGVSCPGPILEAKKLLDTMHSGEVLLLISNCPGSLSDVKAWAKAGAVELDAVVEAGRGTHEFYLRKGG